MKEVVPLGIIQLSKFALYSMWRESYSLHWTNQLLSTEFFWKSSIAQAAIEQTSIMYVDSVIHFVDFP